MTNVQQAAAKVADLQKQLRSAEQDLNKVRRDEADALAMQARQVDLARLAIANREEAEQKLKEVRDRGVRVKSELKEAERTLNQATIERGAAEAHVVNANHAISEHYGAQPKLEDFASDQELAVWQKELQRLITLREQAIARKQRANGAYAVVAGRIPELNEELRRLLNYQTALTDRIQRGVV